MTAILDPVRSELIDALETAGLRVGARVTDRLAAAHDASHYLLVPELVVAPQDASEVALALAVGRRLDVPVTFRSGGTSLSGQSVTSGMLLDTRTHFRGVEVLEAGAIVRVGPGATVRSVNARLLRYKRKLGPDPASEIACTIGGVIANNSSGMACGTHHNAYRTLLSAVLVLPSGTLIDTAGDDADELLRLAEPQLHSGLERLRDRVRNDPASVDSIRRLYSIKNTMGYGLNSFLDHDRAIDILLHLVIGSEGTLAFVAEATFRTVPLPTHLATALLVFPDLAAATASLVDVVAAGFATVELLDSTSLQVARSDPAAPPELLELQIQDHAALLVEYQEGSADALGARIAQGSELLSTLPLTAPAVLTTDGAVRSRLWHLRKGLYTLVAGSRPAGTTALLEDIAVPAARLGATCAGLTVLFERHGYVGSVIFGHAKDGNIHFMLNERFDDPAMLARYEAFTDDLVDLVLGEGGTLKAEHGTGRIMAPYVHRQYGDELHDVMVEVKRLADPGGLLNPGVLLTGDPRAHVRDLKTSPPVEEEVDRCVECGYCEPVCPSHEITTTPRERIVLLREQRRADAAGDTATARALRAEYRYDAIDTCAVDGMCQTACPVLINTGDLVRRLRAEDQNPIAQAGWKAAAQNWDAVSRAGGIALTLAAKVPAALPMLATDIGRAVLGHNAVPRYSAELPAGGRRRPVVDVSDPVAVYFSSCTTTMFGPAGGGGGVTESFLRLCATAGIELSTPEDLPSLCCGTPWKSKGLTDGYAEMRKRVTESLLHATRNGELPVVCDASSCTEGLGVLLEAGLDDRIRVIDAVAFVAEVVLPRLPARHRIPSLTLHPTCSSNRLGLDAALLSVASAASEEVLIPEDWGCCAFAGDRGMLHPELTESATRREASSVRAAASGAHASLNRTCELGMTRATGHEYQHVLEVLEGVQLPR